MMTTTTGGATRDAGLANRWLQTEWPRTKVPPFIGDRPLGDIRGGRPGQPQGVAQGLRGHRLRERCVSSFMSYRNGSVAGAKARVMRISCSGELAYEVNVPANAGRAVWEALMAAGAEFDITPYGTETMHVLRAEKGYIIVGQDTDGSITPYDLGMGGVVAKSKDFLGKRSPTRSDTAKEDRKQFVGLLTDDADLVLPEGAQILAPGTRVSTTEPTPMIGHVTSSYYSPILKRSIALAVVKGGPGKMGQSVAIPPADGRRVMAKISSPVFYDTEGVRQNVE
ncbi:aminomethyltransferase family protein [Cupriavidus basilensis]